MMSFALTGQVERVVGWLTPVWIVSLGVAIGFLLALIVWAALVGLGRVRGLNDLYSTTSKRWTSSLVASAAFFGGLYWWARHNGGFRRGTMDATDFSHSVWALYAFLAIVAIVLGFGFIAAVSKARRDEVRLAIREGFLFWVSTVGVAAIAFVVLGYASSSLDQLRILSVVDEPDEILGSLTELAGSGVEYRELDLGADSPNGGQLLTEVAFEGTLLKTLVIRSDSQVDVSVEPIVDGISPGKYISVPPHHERAFTVVKDGEMEFIPEHRVEGLYVHNRSGVDGKIEIQWLTSPRVSEVAIVPFVAVIVVFVYVFYFSLVATQPKIFAIAHSTFKTELSQPVFIVLAVLGMIFILGSIFVPYNTFGEDIKMYKDSSLTLIRVLGIFLAVWAASKSVAEEIEGRTALTVLSKPVSRRQFVLGKFVGIGLAVGWLYILIGIWFLIWTSYKPIYDTVEMAAYDYGWQNSFDEMISAVPGVVLAFFESLIFVSISVAISTRMGILANFMICFAIYVLGHLTPLIVQSNAAVEAFEGVTTFGYVVSAVLPVLEHFDINAAITGDVDVPIYYLGWSTFYCGLYCLVALLLSFVLFEDRDLA